MQYRYTDGQYVQKNTTHSKKKKSFRHATVTDEAVKVRWVLPVLLVRFTLCFGEIYCFKVIFHAYTMLLSFVVLVPETEMSSLSLQSLKAGNLFIGQHILSHQISEVNDCTPLSWKQM